MNTNFKISEIIKPCEAAYLNQEQLQTTMFGLVILQDCVAENLNLAQVCLQELAEVLQ